MARVLAWTFEPLDMRSSAFFFTSLDSDVTGNSQSALNLQTPSGNRQSFSGSFQLEVDPETGEEFLIGGTITDLSETGSQFESLYWLSELTLPVGIWFDFLLTDDREGLHEYVFAGNDTILGGHQNDVLVGYAGDDLLDGKIGDDVIDGGTGVDSVYLRRLQSQYQIVKANGKIVATDLTGTFGTDTLYDVEVLKFDDVTVVVNNAPVVTVANIKPTHAQAVAGNRLYASLTDADGEAITQYRFIDHTAGNGGFWLDGTALAEQQEILITAAEFAGFEYRPSIVGGDEISIQATDGYSWSAWQSFTIAAASNAAPVAAAVHPTLARGVPAVAASSLFSVSDGDGDAMSRYRFFDGTSGNGHFALSGVTQATRANIEITAAQLASMEFVLGAPGTSDTLWVQAFDGVVWGAWTSFNVTAPQNAAPVAAVSDRTPARGVTAIAAASLVSVTDPDGDAITQYKLFDGTAGSGRFRKGGVVQAELTNITVTAAELATTTFVLGGGSDVLWVQAYDGAAWSTWKSFTVAAPVNAAPVVSINAAALNLAKGTTTVAAASFFGATDPDSDPITQYRFYDGTGGNGRFELYGAPQVERQNIMINAADLANFRFRTGASGGDTLWVQAYDGMAWSAWKSFNVTAPVNVAPTVNVRNLAPTKADTFIAGAALFTVSDPDDASMTKYRFFDGTAGNGYFSLSGNPQVALSNIEINTTDLANFRYVTSTTGVGDTLWVQAYDGSAWSTWKSFTANAPANVAPTVFVEDLVYSNTPSTIDASTLFVVSDPDDANMARYRFYDSEKFGGYFQLNGVAQPEQRNVEIAAADLVNLVYIPVLSSRDTIWIQAFDGVAWSDWKTFDARAWDYGLSFSGGGAGSEMSFPVFNDPPVVTVSNTVAQSGSVVSLDNLLSVSDPEGDAITTWRISDTTAGRGTLRVDGVVQQDLAIVEVMASQLAAAEFLVGGAAGFNRLTASAFDGTSWSDPKTFIINTLAPT